MTRKIDRNVVFSNLRKFRERIFAPGSSSQVGGRIYRVLLNSETGDMRFPQKISALETSIHSRKTKGENPAIWKEVEILVKENAPLGSNFSLRDFSDISDLASFAVSETMALLNQRAKMIKKKPVEVSIEEAVLSDLSFLQALEEEERDPVRELGGWAGSITRNQAEKRLAGTSPGTYLIRKGDEVIQSIEKSYSQLYHQAIRAYILSVMEKEGQIAEYLLLKTQWGWTIFRDFPQLDDMAVYHYDEAVQSVIQRVAKNPLF